MALESLPASIILVTSRMSFWASLISFLSSSAAVAVAARLTTAMALASARPDSRPRAYLVIWSLPCIWVRDGWCGEHRPALRGRAFLLGVWPACPDGKALHTGPPRPMLESPHF